VPASAPAASGSAVEIESALRSVGRRDGDHLQSSRTARRFCLVGLLARVARFRCLRRQNTVDRSSSFDSTRVPDPRGRSSGEPRPGASAGGSARGDSPPAGPPSLAPGRGWRPAHHRAGRRDRGREGLQLRGEPPRVERGRSRRWAGLNGVVIGRSGPGFCHSLGINRCSAYGWPRSPAPRSTVCR